MLVQSRACLALVGAVALQLCAAPASIADDPDAHWYAFGNYEQYGLLGEVSDLAIYQGQLVVAGDFPDVHNQGERTLANCVARWDGSRWHPFAEGVEYPPYPCPPYGPPCHPSISDVGVFRGDLVVVGDFHYAGSRRLEDRARNVARWDGSRWHPLGEGLNNAAVAMAVFSDELVVSGVFTVAGTAPVSGVARWNGTTWRAMGDGLNNFPYAFREFQGNLIAIGGFSTSGTTSLRGIAKWDGLRWLPVAPDWMSKSLSGEDIALFDNTLVTKMYWPPGQVHLSRWDGATWRRWPSGDVGEAFALAPYNGRLIAGGNMQPEYYPYSYIAQDKDGRWQAMGSGVDGHVLEMLEHEGSLYVAGRFVHAGGRFSTRIARWDDVITPVSLYDFAASNESGGVRLQWQLSTAGRDELLGVEVQRADDFSNPFHLLTETPLPPETQMSYFDPDVSAGASLAYRLVLREHDGENQIAGPIYIRVGSTATVSLRASSDPGSGRPLSIRYSIARSVADVRLEVFDMRGRRIRTLDHGPATSGEHLRYWDRLTATGSRAVRGVYIVRLDAGGTEVSRKITVLHD